jgi:hypothetical protein
MGNGKWEMVNDKPNESAKVDELAAWLNCFVMGVIYLASLIALVALLGFFAILIGS